MTNSSTGTTINLLAKVINGGAVKAATTDITTPTYIVVAGAGIAGSAQMAVAGQAECIMDGMSSSAEGDPVIASTSTAGQCRVVTSGYPAPGTWVIGQMVSNTTSAGTAATVLVSPGFPSITGPSGLLGTGTSLVLASSLSNSSGTELVTATGSLTSNTITKFDGSGNVVISSLTDNGTTLNLGSDSVQLNRASIVNGTAGSVSLTGGGMGMGATGSVVMGSDQAAEIQVETGTSGIATKPYFEFNFSSTWGSGNPPVCISQMETWSSGNAINVTTSTTTSYVKVTFGSMPGTSITYTINVICFATS